jgi:hypothetical protein
MSLIVLALIALSATVAVAGLSLALYASLPQKFLDTADAGRYAGLTAQVQATASSERQSTVQIGSLQDQSA